VTVFRRSNYGYFIVFIVLLFLNDDSIMLFVVFYQGIGVAARCI